MSLPEVSSFFSNSNSRAYYNFHKKVLPSLERLEIAFLEVILEVINFMILMV